MTQPILHNRTQAALAAYLNQPTHGLILAGEEGIGKLYIAKWIAKKLGTQSFVLAVSDDKSTISIEQIRDLYNLTRTGSGLTVIIQNSHLMGREAQNAFLKLLEEPPKDTKFILTSKDTHSLLPTIQSRSQTIAVLIPNPDELLKLGSEITGKPESALEGLLHTTKRLPGKFIGLLENETIMEDHQSTVEKAKQFYAASAYDRNIMCIEQKFDKTWITDLLDVLVVIIRSLIKQNLNNPSVIKKLRLQAELVEETTQNILAINGNPKIHLAKLCENL